jgi:hypothetical protein
MIITNMKALNNFLDKDHLFKVFLFGWAFTATFTFILFAGFSTIEAQINLAKSAGIGATMGLPFGLMFMLMISMMRKSTKFWDYAKVVEALIDKAETKDELGSIYKGEFQSLRELAQGGPHLSELTRQYTIMQTKYKYGK